MIMPVMNFVSYLSYVGIAWSAGCAWPPGR